MPTARVLRSEERFSRNAETDLVCRLLLEKKKKQMIQNRHATCRHRRSPSCSIHICAQVVPQSTCGGSASLCFCFLSARFFFFFFFNDTATTEIYTLSLHDALPI